MEIVYDDWRRPSYTSQNNEIYYEIERLPHFKGNKKPIFAAAQQLSAGIPFASSIDSFLEIRKDNPDITLLAKAALVYLILERERSSNLATERARGQLTLRPDAIDGTWYQEFAQLFFEKVGVDGIEEAFKQLAVIDFNYDRCFEQVLFHALTGLYNLPIPRASELLARVRVMHPYGTVGELYIPREGLSRVDFGADPRGLYLRLTDGIRTFTEQISDNGLLEEIRQEIADAESIVFLGCAFHVQNMELLKLSKPSPKLIFGTTYGMSPADNAHVKARLQAMFARTGRSGTVGSSDIQMEGVKCVDFLKQFRRTLSAD